MTAVICGLTANRSALLDGIDMNHNLMRAFFAKFTPLTLLATSMPIVVLATALADSGHGGADPLAEVSAATGPITWVNRPPGGAAPQNGPGQGGGDTTSSSMTPNGRFVAFASGVTNLVPGDTNGMPDAFVWDRDDGSIKRISTTSTGAQQTIRKPQASGGTVAITPDGRYVFFSSEATNLVANDSNGIVDLFRKDTLNGSVVRVTTDPSGNQMTTSLSGGDTPAPYISDDGRFVAFTEADSTGYTFVLLRDVTLGTSVRMDTKADGTPMELGSNRIAGMTADGRYLLIDAYATPRCIPCDLNGQPQPPRSSLYVKDRITGDLEAVDVTENGDPLEGSGMSISRDGRFVSFASRQTSPYGPQGFVRDRVNHTTRQFTKAPDGSDSWNSTNTIGMGGARVSASGRFVVWSSDATNLVPGTYCSNWLSCADYVYRRDLTTGEIKILNRDMYGQIINDNNGYASITGMSDDARWVSFISPNSGPLLASGANGYFNLFLSDANAFFPVAPPSISAAQTYGGTGYSIYGPRPVGYAADPVNTATGAFATSTTDASIPSIGIPIAFTRTYNSNDQTSGRLGQGWTDSYGASVQVSPDGGTVTFRAGDGQQLTYVRNADGSFAGQGGATATLTQQANGSYALSTHGRQLTYGFDSAGVVHSIKDGNGQGLDFSYDQSGHMSDIHGSGGTVHLAYTNGLLSQLTTPGGRRVTYGYVVGADGVSRLSSVRGPGTTSVDYAYDSGGRLNKVTDAKGHTPVRLTYNATTGRVTDQWDAADKHTTFAWDPATSTSTMTTPRGGTYTDVYSGNVLVSQTDPVGNTTQYEYDQSDRLIAVQDARGNESDLTYDADGNLTQEHQPNGATYRYTYNNAGQQTSSTTPNGTTVQYGYDTNGNPVSTTWPTVGGTGTVARVLTRDPSTGLVVASKDQRDKVTHYTYDAMGNLSSVTDPTGAVTTYTYDGDGRLISSVDPRGNAAGADPDQYRSVTQLDDAGRSTATITPLGNGVVDSFTRGNSGGLGQKTESGRSWNALLGTFGISDGAAYLSSDAGTGNLATFTAGSDGTVSFTEPSAQSGLGIAFRAKDSSNYWRLTADTTATNWRLIKRINGTDTIVASTPAGTCCQGGLISVDFAGTSITVKVDGQTELSATGSELQTETKVGLYAAGTGAGRIDDLLYAAPNNATRSAYDPVGNQIAVTDANGHTTQWSYTATNHVSTQTSPDPGIPNQAWSYDADGNVASYTDPKGHVTTYSYDLADRLKTTNGPSGAWGFGYDASGNRTSVTDPSNATVELAYDDLNRVSSITYPDGTPSVKYTYSLDGNRSSMTDGNGTQTYEYDALDRLTSVTRGADTFTYGYDAANNLTSRTIPGRAVDTFTYDDAGRLATVASAGVTQATYGYDAAGHPLAVTLPSTNGYVEKRSYDRSGRLTEVANVKGTSVLTKSTLTLDGVGNPTQIVDQTGAANTYRYDAVDRLLQACLGATTCNNPANFITYAYDPNGNRTSEARPTGTTTYSYNSADELSSIAGASGNVSYSYDAAGNVTTAGGTTYTWNKAGKMTTATAAGVTTTYKYDGDGRRTRASTGTQTANVTQTLWDPLSYQLAAERDGSGATLRSYLYGSQVIAEVAGGINYYYHHDQLGSIAALTDKSGLPQWTYTYDPYGAAKSSVKAASKAPVNPLQYGGQYVGTSGAIYHLRNRQYDPALGRFLSPDPAGDTGSGPYGYMESNPMVGVDSYGLCCDGYRSGSLEGVTNASDPSVTVVSGSPTGMAFNTCSSAKGSCPGTFVEASFFGGGPEDLSKVGLFGDALEFVDALQQHRWGDALKMTVAVPVGVATEAGCQFLASPTAAAGPLAYAGATVGCYGAGSLASTTTQWALDPLTKPYNQY